MRSPRRAGFPQDDDWPHPQADRIATVFPARAGAFDRLLHAPTPREVSAEYLALMRRIDELHLEHPFAGARMLRDFLRREGFQAGRKHIGTRISAHGDRSALSEAPYLSSTAGG